MKTLFILLLLYIVVESCTKDPDAWKGINLETAIETGTNKSFALYTYREYQPLFYTSIDFLKDTVINSVRSFFASPKDVVLPLNGKNPTMADEKANVGRILFYDKNLSANGQLACGSCHIQSKAFTDGLALSKGHRGELTAVSSMSIQNLAYLNNYFWDSRSQSLDKVVTQPLLNPVEMGNSNMAAVVGKIKSKPYYTGLFKYAFGEAEITEHSITEALAHFVQSIYSSNTRFDIGRQYAFQNFSSQEKAGLDLFNGKAQCNHCHTAPTFAAPDFDGGAYGTNSTSTIPAIGAPIPVFNAPGNGRTNNGLTAIVDQNKKDLFKIPTLRNIAVTGPYMHDGRFKTLEEVIEYYDHEVVFNPALDPVLIDAVNPKLAKKLQLSKDEKNSLLAFLHTLTDQTLLTAPRYSDPF